MPKDIFFIVDGHALAYRAFFALPPLTSPTGEPTGAIHGFLRKLLKIRRETEPSRFVVIFDGKGPTFRDELSEAYKATRKPMPDELRSQIDRLKVLVPLLGFPSTAVDLVEADDVIATLALKARDGYDVEILSGDKDLTALAGDSITLLAPSQDIKDETRLDRAGVKKKFGVFPEQIGDWLSLVGDTSDNIPGVPGVGKVTATKLLEKYGGIDGILSSLDELTPKLQEKFRENSDQFELSRKLVELKCDVDIDLAELTAELTEPSEEGLEMLNLYGMKAIFDEFNAFRESTTVAAIEIPETKILAGSDLIGWLERAGKLPVAIDTETTSLRPREAQLLGVSLGTSQSAAWLPAANITDEARNVLSRFLSDPDRAKCAHNWKYDYQILLGHGFEDHRISIDTLIASALLNPLRRSNSLDTLALERFRHEMIPFESLGDIEQADPEVLARYAGEDAYITALLADECLAQLDKDPGLARAYYDIEHPLISVLAEMEWKGVGIDISALGKLGESLRKELVDLEKKAFELAGEEFNLASTKQLAEIFFERLGLTPVRKTKTGFSTDASTLEQLKEHHPLPGIILEHREIAKLLNTYVETLPAMVSPLTGRVHTSYLQARTVTGRLASADPNLQNIPVRTARGQEIRRAFTAPKGRVLVTADYSQIEFRLAAWMANETELLEAFDAGYDVHSATAAKIWGLPPDQIDTDLRRQAKAVNFGLLYGQSAHGLATTLGITRKDAAEIIRKYFDSFPRMKLWIDETKEEARVSGEAVTWFGRRRPLPEIASSRVQVREAAERTAINTPVQGTAADIIKLAMIKLQDRLAADPDTDMIMQVHDELICETTSDKSEEIAEIMSEIMRNIPPFDSLLATSSGAGPNWLEASH